LYPPSLCALFFLFYFLSLFLSFFFLLLLLRPPTSTLFPYTTLFRSCSDAGSARLSPVADLLRSSLSTVLSIPRICAAIPHRTSPAKSPTVRAAMTRAIIDPQLCPHTTQRRSGRLSRTFLCRVSSSETTTRAASSPASAQMPDCMAVRP